MTPKADSKAPPSQSKMPDADLLSPLTNKRASFGSSDALQTPDHEKEVVAKDGANGKDTKESSSVASRSLRLLRRKQKPKIKPPKIVTPLEGVVVAPGKSIR